MSKPNTRGKSKRPRTEECDDPSSRILRKIHSSGEITESDLRQLYLVWKPVCQGCRCNTKESPNCFCGFLPLSNGNKKSGLWQKMPEIILSLGPNPCKDLRSSTDTPAGLTNLGATCYANSILQCLYMNASFRAGIFSIEPDLLKQHPVLNQLARLFAQLHSSKLAFIDSAPFTKTLELDNGVQQDSHEFLTLFLSLLERSLSHSKLSSAKTMVQDLFSGSVSHVTRCSVCGQDSEASSKMEDFYEIELNIKGLKNLDESLDEYLSIEKLHGDNQYFCESCGTRVDATRSIKLRSLPSVLNFQLKRYVFLPKTTTKKKITSSFSFPRRLNMTKRMCNPSQSDLIYELSAILIHKGAAVNSGHYVAHIKDGNTGQWWEFDDEHVSKLGSHPFGEVSNKSSVKHKATGLSDSFEKVEPTANGNHADPQMPSSNANMPSHEEMFASTDAYMLMYNCINIKGTADAMDLDAGTNHDLLPVYLSEEIHELNASCVAACEEYQSRKDRQVALVTERQQEVKSIIAEAPVHSDEHPYFWISTEWLRLWADSISPPCIDNNPIQCLHGKVPVSKVTAMKRLSNAAWQKLLSKYGGGPTLSDNDYCVDCLKEDAKKAVFADDYRGRKASLRKEAEAALAGKLSDGCAYYVSRAWLLQWLRRKNSDHPCDADAGPTASLSCSHGGLLPEQAAGAKRVSIPESLWLFLFENASVVRPDDLLGAKTFPSDSEPCEVCSRELSEVASLEDNIRAAKLKQRQNHEKLIMGKNLSVSLGCKYFLVPGSWLTQWKSYVTATGKNKSSLAEPENLQVIIDSLVCDKHSGLLERPPELVYKRGAITPRLSGTDGLTLVSESDWNLFCEEWDVAARTGIHAEIAFTNGDSSEIILARSCESTQISDDDFNRPVDETYELEGRIPFIRTQPEVCEECIGERESCNLMRKLNYCDENICVHLVRGKEAPRSIKEASGIVRDQERRTSKRSRKSTSGNSVNLKVSCSTSVYQLKMMIWEAFGVVKENQKLHKGAVEIDGDKASLADKNIFPGDVLWVTDLELYENRDIADELSEPKNEPQQAEEGFRGTLLTSGVSLQEW